MDGVWNTEELFETVIQSLDSIEVAHLSNWAKIGAAIKSLEELKQGYTNREKAHQKRINEIRAGYEDTINQLKEDMKKHGVVFFDEHDVQGQEQADQLCIGSEKKAS